MSKRIPGGPVYYSMMRRLFFVLVLACSFIAGARSVALPELPARMGVEAHVAEEAQDALVRVLRRQIGAEVIAVPLVTPGLAGSLDGEMARLIAELGEARFGISGEVSRDSDQYRLTLLVADREARAVSDLFSAVFSAAEVSAGIEQLVPPLREFLALPTTPPSGNAGLFISTVPSGVEVRIDNRVVGKSGNLDILMLEPGRYTVEARHEGYLPEMRRVEVQDGEIELLRLVLTPLSGGSITIDSIPAAQVFLGNEALGVTPLSIPVAAGTHELRLERLGFASQLLPVLVRDYRVSRVVAELEPLTDVVVIWDAPPGTIVQIDGETYVSFAFDVKPGLRNIVVTFPDGTVVERLVAFPTKGVLTLDPHTATLTMLRGAGAPAAAP